MEQLINCSEGDHISGVCRVAPPGEERAADSFPGDTAGGSLMTTAPADDAAADTEGDDTCSDPFDEGCTASLDDGEGWDGACGNCADRQAATEEEQCWEDGADDDINGEGSDR